MNLKVTKLGWPASFRLLSPPHDRPSPSCILVTHHSPRFLFFYTDNLIGDTIDSQLNHLYAHGKVCPIDPATLSFGIVDFDADAIVLKATTSCHPSVRKNRLHVTRCYDISSPGLIHQYIERMRWQSKLAAETPNDDGQEQEPAHIREAICAKLGPSCTKRVPLEQTHRSGKASELNRGS